MIYDSFQEQVINLAINEFNGLDKKNSTSLGGIDLCQNWRYTKNKHLTLRPAYAKYNNTSLGSYPMRYLKRIYIGSNKYLIGVCNTSAVVGTDSQQEFHLASALKTDLNASLRYTGDTFKNYHYFGNGTNSNIKTDGTAAGTDIMGLSAMSVTPTISLSATVPTCALDTALYKYKFSWIYNSYQESNASCLTSATAENAVSCIMLSSFQSAPTHVTGVSLYRTEGGADIYYHLSTIGYGTASSGPYYDKAADTALTTTKTAPTDNGLPPATKFFKLHKERMFLAGNSTYKSRLYFSKISDVISYPDIYPVGNYIDISPDDGDNITGLEIDPTGYLCIFKKNSIRKIFTDGNPDEWTVSEPFSLYGAWASQSIKPTPQGIIYLGRHGWRIFDGQNSTLISNTDKINSIINSEILDTQFEDCTAHFHHNLYYLSYPDSDSGSTENNRLLIYDTLTDNFSIDTKYIDSFTTFEGGDDWNELVYGDSRMGLAYKELETDGTIIYNKLSQFRPGGTLADLIAYNTESSPYVELAGNWSLDRLSPSSLDILSPSSLDDFPSAYSISGTYISPGIQVNATTLKSIYWNETLGSHGDITMAVRLASTSAGLSGASWSSEFTNPNGSDISGETANDWLQFRTILSAYGLGAGGLSATPRLSVGVNDYAIKINYGISGATVESKIQAKWNSPYMQLTPENNNSKLDRFEMDFSDGNGNISCEWDLDYDKESGTFVIDLDNYSRNYSSPFPTNAYGKKLQLKLRYDGLTEVTIKAINILHAPQPTRY